MGVCKNIFLVFFLIFLLLLNKESLFASPKNEILCQGWLGKLPGNNGQKSCKEVEGNEEGIKNCSDPDPSYSDGDDEDRIYRISDNIGILGACRDYFPTWGEREFFYRESSDPLNVVLAVKRQYCWARFVLDHTKNCGAPKYKFPFTFTWKHGGAYAVWGDTKKKKFKLNDEIGIEHKKTIFWGSNSAYMDYEDMKDENGNIIKDKYGNAKKNPKRVCGYYVPTFMASLFTSRHVIGCVDVPLMPAPPIYNKILVPRKTVAVSSTEPDNNTFKNPKINLTVLDTMGKEIGPIRTLTYDFNKADDKQQCVFLLNEYFCPTFSSTSANKICAKEKNTASVLGCIGRKTMAESGIKMEVIHDYNIDYDCNTDPTKPSVFQALRIKLTRPDKSSKIYPSGDMRSGDAIREYYSCTKKITNPKDRSKMINMTNNGFDSVDILGVEFSAIIPKFQNENTEKFEQIYLQPPQILKNYPNEFQKSCDNCFVTSLDPKDSQPYIVPAGKRDRSSCKKSYKCMNLNVDPQEEEKCTFGYNGSYNDAEKTYCSGVYMGPDENTNTQDKICIKLETDWNGFFGPKDNKENLCADIPRSYMKLGKDNVSAITGYADFSNDGYDPTKTYPKDHKFYGECHSSLGLEETKLVPDDIPQIDGLNPRAVFSLKSRYIALKQQFTDVNANPPLLSKKLLSLLGFNVGKVHNQNVTIARPYRTLDGNFPLGNIHNPCKFISGEEGCTNSTDTSDFFGNANYTPEKKLTIGGVFPPTSSSNTDWDENIITTDLLIDGECRSGFSSATSNTDKPSRICRIATNKDNKIISKAWTNFPPNNPCTKPNS